MNWEDYQADDLSAPSRAGAEIRNLTVKAPLRAERLVDALDTFIRQPLSMATLLAPPNGTSTGVEVYLVPQGYIFAMQEDSAALVAVDHGIGNWKVIEVIEEFGGSGPHAAQQWQRIRSVAQALAVP